MLSTNIVERGSARWSRYLLAQHGYVWHSVCLLLSNSSFARSRIYKTRRISNRISYNSIRLLRGRSRHRRQGALDSRWSNNYISRLWFQITQMNLQRISIVTWSWGDFFRLNYKTGQERRAVDSRIAVALRQRYLAVWDQTSRTIQNHHKENKTGKHGTHFWSSWVTWANRRNSQNSYAAPLAAQDGLGWVSAYRHSDKMTFLWISIVCSERTQNPKKSPWKCPVSLDWNTRLLRCQHEGIWGMRLHQN